VGEKFTETNMNPKLKGRDMRKALIPTITK
jgi:hypothetical protein